MTLLQKETRELLDKLSSDVIDAIDLLAADPQEENAEEQALVFLNRVLDAIREAITDADEHQELLHQAMNPQSDIERIHAIEQRLDKVEAWQNEFDLARDKVRAATVASSTQ